MLKKSINKKNNYRVDNTPHTFSYMVLKPDDRPISDGVYDILKDEWIRGPVKIPETFDPDKTFIKERIIAEKAAQAIDLIIGYIIRVTDDLKAIDQFNKDSSKHTKQIDKLQYLCRALNAWYDWIWKLQKDAKNKVYPVYPAFNFSPNWDRKMIIFKYLARHGYQQCIVMLYRQLKDSPYLNIIDQFIPD